MTTTPVKSGPEPTATPRSALMASIKADQRRLVGRRLRGNQQVMIGGGIVVLIVLLAVFGPLFSADPYRITVIERLSPPGAGHLFGTDNFGRDLFARVVQGSRISLLVGLSVAIATSIAGTLIGLVAAYWRPADLVLMRILDAFMAFPAILLAIAIMAALGPSTVNTVFALSIVFTPHVARVIRSAALVVKEQTFVEALRSQGAPAWRILALNIAPNVLSPLIVQATFIFADSIITEAALSFLGAGVPPPAPTWGNILFDGKTLIFSSWWMTVFPGLAVMLTVLAINLLGDGLHDVLDPHHPGR